MLVVLVVLILAALVNGWRAFGQGASGERLARMSRSPQYKDGHFENPQPLVNDAWGSLTGASQASPDRFPKEPVPTETVDPKRFETPPASGLRVTWLGHSTMLVEVDGAKVLTDPIWSERISPVDAVGPTRFFPPLIALASMPVPDAVIISHDHFDHLDYPTIVAMKDWPTTFVVPLGVGAHLSYWGVPDAHIKELDWWEEATLGDLTITCTPARHASGRTAWDKDHTLWAGYALVGKSHRVYYSGDTGLFPAMADIGARLGPFDLTMIETGQYHQAWPDWHIGPEQAVDAHKIVRGRAMLPVHWSLLGLAYHAWTEPGERVLRAAEKAKVTLLLPKPGQSIEPTIAEPALPRWWPNVPTKTAEQDPIVSGNLGNLIVPQ
jgi:L-ascorbate metabolism protein UlaG (beta-lactamase superfamily)